MTQQPSSAATGPLLPTARPPWLIINGLGLYVLLMYGITYYAISTAAPRMAVTFGIGVSSVFALLTVSLLATAMVAPALGRWVDKIGSTRALLIGTVARAVALALMALAPEFWSFAAAFVVVQVLGQLTEYDATFAVAVDLAGNDARKAMSQITLWGGLASTAFWPLTALMLRHMAWQDMLLVHVLLLAVVAVPIAARAGQIAQRRGGRGAAAANPGADRDVPSPPPAPSPLVFSVLAAAFAFGGVAYTLPALMLPVLEGLGLGAAAIVAGMLFGPAQTAGRFMDLLLGTRVKALHVAIMATAMLLVALAVLLLGSGIPEMAMVFAMLFGAGAGVSYVARGSVVLEIYGTEAYALWLGRLSSVRLVVSAASPFVLSLVLENLGAASVIAVCLGVAMLSLGCFLWLAWRLRAGH